LRLRAVRGNTLAIFRFGQHKPYGAIVFPGAPPQ